MTMSVCTVKWEPKTASETVPRCCLSAWSAIFRGSRQRWNLRVLCFSLDRRRCVIRGNT